MSYETANLVVPMTDVLARLSMYKEGVEAFFSHMSALGDEESEPAVRRAYHGVLIALRGLCHNDRPC